MTAAGLAQRAIQERGYLVICPRGELRYRAILTGVHRLGDRVEQPMVNVGPTDVTDYLEQCELLEISPAYGHASKFFRVVTD